ncbi:MAG TPA: MEDS domain-containing protein [Acidobacteriaceae bacterium]|nr:MEDS domain-containing protein [Acidobacteriaceae bacterium]
MFSSEPQARQALPAPALALPQDVHAGSHTVDFYTDDDAFLDNLSDMIGSALKVGGVCLVIAAAPHRQGIARRLRAAGIDLPLAVRNRQYLLLDAEATLAKFMVDGVPDRDRFFAAIEPLLADARESLGPNVSFPVAFGEMVAILWAEGKRDAAIRLEQLWNELGSRHSFALRCAYPKDNFADADQAAFFQQICAEHNHILSSEHRN